MNLRKAVLIGSGLLLLVLLSLRIHTRMQLNRMIAEIREAGEPVSHADLDAWYAAPPDEENAALILTNAFALLKVELTDAEKERLAFLGSASIPPLGEPLAADMLESMGDVVERHGEGLELLEQGLSRPAARYPGAVMTPDTEILGWSFFEGVDSRRVLNFLSEKAALEAEQGDVEAAVQTIIHSFKLSHTFHNQPLVISQLIHMGNLRLSLGQSQRLLSRRQLTPDQLGQLQPLVRRLADGFDLSDAVAGERAFSLHMAYVEPSMANRMLAYGAAVWSEQDASTWERLWIDVKMLTYRMSGIGDRDLMFYLDVMGKMQRAAQGTLQEQWELSQVYPTWSPSGFGSRFYTLSTMALPNFESFLSRGVETVLHLHAAECVLAVENYRHAHEGQLPENLEDLVPVFLERVIVDPRDQRPLRLELKADGYSIECSESLFTVKHPTRTTAED